MNSPTWTAGTLSPPLIPVNTDYTKSIYRMVLHALKEAEKKRIAEKKKGREATHDT